MKWDICKNISNVKKQVGETHCGTICNVQSHIRTFPNKSSYTLIMNNVTGGDIKSHSTRMHHVLHGHVRRKIVRHHWVVASWVSENYAACGLSSTAKFLLSESGDGGRREIRRAPNLG